LRVHPVATLRTEPSSGCEPVNPTSSSTSCGRLKATKNCREPHERRPADQRLHHLADGHHQDGHHQLGLAVPEDIAAKPWVRRGVALEDQVRQGFEARHNTLLLPLCVESTAHPVLRASLDGLSEAGEPVELKVPTEKTHRLLLAQGSDATAYQLAWVQLQQQLYVTEADCGWLVFDPCLPALQPLEFRIQRDERFLHQALVPRCLAFWAQLRAGSPPVPDPAPADATYAFYC